MRSIAFVDHIKFKIDGNVSANAITIGDCDNDSANELIAATLEGDLSIFKGSQTHCWAISQGLGMVISVIVGDILNNQKNCIVCVSVEGFCNIFNLSSDSTHKPNPSHKINLSSKSNTIIDSDEKCVAKQLTPFYTQRLPANAKIICLADIDNDGQNELIVGLTDRVVRVYRCVHMSDQKIKLVGIYKWEFIDQIGTLSLNPCSVGNYEHKDTKHVWKAHSILVAQPGGTYAKIECLDKRVTVTSDDQVNSSETVSKLMPEYYELSIGQMRNPNISTEILGGIKGRNRAGHKTDSLIALATLDGTLMLVDGSDILWSLQVDHQLFALSKLNITPDSDSEEIIACSWDGLTYIVDQNRESVRFKFDEPVSAFIAGHYTLCPSEPDVKCIVYATFNNSIYLYLNIDVNRIKSSDFRQTIQNKPELIEDVNRLITLLGLQNNDLKTVQTICSDILYGFP